MHLTLMHISDLHAGPPFNAEKAELIVREAEELQPRSTSHFWRHGTACRLYQPMARYSGIHPTATPATVDRSRQP